jgi:hypothetical protein
LRTVQGIEFRSVTIEAFRGDTTTAGAPEFAVIYCGPFREILDDCGRRFRRGEITSVDAATFARLGNAPYTENFELLQPAETSGNGRAKFVPFNAPPLPGKNFASANTGSDCCRPGQCC